MKRLLLILALLLSSASAHAAELFPDPDYGMEDRICEILPFCDRGKELISDIAQAIISTLLPVLAISAIASIAFAGLKLVQSNGDEAALDTAKKIVLTAIIGSFVALASVGLMIFLYKLVSRAT